jgi:hypothetical protein
MKISIRYHYYIEKVVPQRRHSINEKKRLYLDFARSHINEYQLKIRHITDHRPYIHCQRDHKKEEMTQLFLIQIKFYI